jgi:hypothetical protein
MATKEVFRLVTGDRHEEAGGAGESEVTYDQTRWDPGVTLGFVLASSATLWVAISLSCLFML